MATITSPPAHSPWATLLRGLRAAGVGSLAGALSGIVWGALARGSMRVIVRALEQRPSFSWEGTLMILVFGAMLGGVIGVIYAGLRPMLPWGRAWRAAVLGAALLLTIGIWIATGPLVQEGGPRIFPLAMSLFAASLLAWAAMLEALYAPLDRRLLRGAQGRLARAATAIAMALPIAMWGALALAQTLGLAEG